MYTNGFFFSVLESKVNSFSVLFYKIRKKIDTLNWGKKVGFSRCKNKLVIEVFGVPYPLNVGGCPTDGRYKMTHSIRLTSDLDYLFCY